LTHILVEFVIFTWHFEFVMLRRLDISSLLDITNSKCHVNITNSTSIWVNEFMTMMHMCLCLTAFGISLICPFKITCCKRHVSITNSTSIWISEFMTMMHLCLRLMAIGISMSRFKIINPERHVIVTNFTSRRVNGLIMTHVCLCLMAVGTSCPLKITNSKCHANITNSTSICVNESITMMRMWLAYQWVILKLWAERFK